MYEELHVTSPVVPTREFCFLRYCRQIEHGLWAIADVSVDLQPRDARFGAPPSRSCRLPSGCLIADMANGYSKVITFLRAAPAIPIPPARPPYVCHVRCLLRPCVRVILVSRMQVTWVEHMEIEDRVPIHLLYRDLILSGAAFGAHRWLAVLQRACERSACLTTAPRDMAGGVCSARSSLMMLCGLAGVV
jgi:homeobox-leucine zipper protein